MYGPRGFYSFTNSITYKRDLLGFQRARAPEQARHDLLPALVPRPTPY